MLSKQIKAMENKQVGQALAEGMDIGLGDEFKGRS